MPFATMNPLTRPHTTPIAQAGRMARTPMLPEVFAATQRGDRHDGADGKIDRAGNDHEGHAQRRDQQDDGLLRNNHEIVELKKARRGQREGDCKRDKQENREEAACAFAPEKDCGRLVARRRRQALRKSCRPPHVMCRMIASSDAEAGSSILATIRPARMTRMRSLRPMSSLRSSLARRMPRPRSAASRNDR